MNTKTLSRYFNAFINFLPTELDSFDTSRVVILQFALSGLDVIDKLSSLSDDRKKQIIEWIYSLEIISEDRQTLGFRGGYFPSERINDNYMSCHLTMTYSSLTCLIVLGDDLSRLDKKGVAQAISKLQSSDGCFSAALDCPESDVRFIFSAMAACELLGEFSYIDCEKTYEFLKRCQNSDGGFGQRPDSESHGGSTYCALASMKILNKLKDFLEEQDNLKKLLNWLMRRQTEGFSGRPHKADDSCYTFWIGASLKILGYATLINFESLLKFINQTHDSKSGGFCKLKNYNAADPLHTYLTLAGLASFKEEITNSGVQSNMDDAMNELLEALCPLNPTLNITYRALQTQLDREFKEKLVV